jgi:hypothetical protein
MRLRLVVLALLVTVAEVAAAAAKQDDGEGTEGVEKGGRALSSGGAPQLPALRS